MDSALHIVLDLGSDSLKIVYGYSTYSEEYHYGVLQPKNRSDIGIPAIALFDKANEKWLFGYEVADSGITDFTTLVQIKDLISLLESTHKSDRTHYSSKTTYPKYELPDERNAQGSMEDIINANKAFDGKITPQELCTRFFKYAKKIINTNVKSIGYLDEYRFSIIYPAGMNVYSKELQRIVDEVFGKVNKNINAVKSFCLYANERKLISDADKILVFDIGEKQISVAKAWMRDKIPYVDGVEGHNLPEEIGGITIDEAIRKGIEKELYMRETVATPSFNKPGHISEVCIDSKKYQLLKDIKMSKHLLSASNAKEYCPNGVPLYLAYECFVRYVLTEGKMNDYVCASNGGECAFEKIANYISTEVKKAMNKDVTKIFLTGGVASTRGLVEYVRKKLGEKGKLITTPSSLRSTASTSSKFDVADKDANTYACALGAVIAAVKGVDIQTVLSLTYGTLGVFDNEYIIFDSFVERGTKLGSRTKTFTTKEGFTYKLKNGESLLRIKDDAIMSTAMSSLELMAESKKPEKRCYFYYRNDNAYLLLLNGTGNTTKLKKEFQKSYPSDPIKCYGLTAEKFSDIVFRYNNELVFITPKSTGEINWKFNEGIRVTPDGEATVCFENLADLFTKVYVTPYKNYDPNFNRQKMNCGERKEVYLKDITLHFYDESAIKLKSN